MKQNNTEGEGDSLSCKLTSLIFSSNSFFKESINTVWIKIKNIRIKNYLNDNVNMLA